MRQSLRVAIACLALVATLPGPVARSSPAALAATPLGHLGGSYGYLQIMGLNDSDVVVGNAPTPNNSHFVGFRWTPTGGIEKLPVPSDDFGVVAVNNHGDVTGMFRDANGNTKGYYWSSTLGFFDLGFDTYPKALNENGEVVGETPPGSSNRHAFYWSRARGLVDLGTLGGQASYAVAINNSGVVVGNSETSVTIPGTRAFTWKFNGGGMKDLGTLGGRDSMAAGINDDGKIVGAAAVATGALHATLWNKNQKIDLTPGAGSSMGNAINRNGDVAGTIAGPSGDTSRAFKWTAAGGMIDIGTLGGASADARAINNAGQVAGTSRTSDYVERAFLWTPGSGMIQVSSAVDTNSVAGYLNAGGAVAGWTRNAAGVDKGFYYSAATGLKRINGFDWGDSLAVAINDSGRVAGDSINPDGYTRAFTWTSAGGMVELATPSAYNSTVLAMNNAGEILGQYYGSNFSPHGLFFWSPSTNVVSVITIDNVQIGEAAALSEDGTVVGQGQITYPPSPVMFLWKVGATTQIISHPQNYPPFPVAINTAGQVAGWVYGAGFQQRAFSWTSTGGFVDLGDLGGGSAVAVGVNTAGQIGGSSAIPGGNPHAFLYARGRMTDLGDLGQGATAVAMNEAGAIIGHSATLLGETHPFLRDSKMRDLGTLGGGFGLAKGVNEVPEVVGWSYTAAGEPHGFLWRKSSGIVDLGTLGGSESQANAINESGQAAGFAFTADGSRIAVVWATR
jgi:probable HAF family extracellular repeat protein